MQSSDGHTTETLNRTGSELTVQIMESIIDSIPSGLFVFRYSDPGKFILENTNNEAEELTGISGKKFRGTDLTEIWPIADESGLISQYVDVLQSGEHYEHENTYYDKGKLQGSYRVRAFKIPGNRLGIAFVDITIAELTYNELKEKERLYNLLAGHMSDAVWIMDLNLMTTYHSPSSMRLRGYTEEEIMKIPPSRQVTAESFLRGISIFTEEIEKAKADPEYNFVRSLELEFYRKDGSTIWTDCTFTLIRDNNDNPSAILGEARDITERKNYEEKINRLLAEKEILLREVHHRVKNNMGTIISLLYLQAGTVGDRATSEALTDASNRIRSMMLIYDKLYQSSDFRVISAELYLSDLIDSVTKAISTVDNIRVEKNIDDCLTLNTSTLYPIGIIINELITNSFKYAFPEGEDGEISITLTCSETHATLIFRDSGTGIPDDYLIGDPRGFGINLVRILTDQINGSVEIRNSKGTEYIFTIPIKKF